MDQSVVKLEYRGDIAVVKMEERQYRNTFSQALVKGLVATFQSIRENQNAKVVVIHGYGQYFCCGGTKEELIGIFEGKLKFTDLSFYDLLLKCELPVISAMQGHGIGGGLVFGSYADIIVMGEECMYSAVFMKYGFTPGMGATYILPKKFGQSLGQELLYTAKNYSGAELRQRGIPFKVVKKADVLPAAIQLAEELAEMPRASLMLLKQHLTESIRRELPSVIEKELKMHEISFAQPEVRSRIERIFSERGQ